MLAEWGSKSSIVVSSVMVAQGDLCISPLLKVCVYWYNWKLIC